MDYPMFSSRSFWFSAGALLLLIALITSTFRQSDSSVSSTIAVITPASETAIDSETTLAESIRQLPADAPVPAQKLQKLIEEEAVGRLPSEQSSLGHRVQTLDTDLAAIDKELKAKGFDVPEKSSSSASQSSQIEQRLRAITHHMDSRSSALP
jgi:hypothetical protein